MAADEMAIAWIVSKKLGMTTIARDLTIFQKTDLVNFRQRFGSVGNEESGSTSQVVKDCFRKSAPGPVVESFCGFIQDPDR